MKVLICGGGNGAHVLAALSASDPKLDTNVFTVFEDEAERWTKAMDEHDFKVTRHQVGKETEVIHAQPKIVSKNPADVVPGSDLIVLVVPAFAHEQYLKAIKPHLKPGCVIVGLPGQAGFEFQVNDILGDLSKEISVLPCDTLPWACRILEFGSHVEVLGTKDSLYASVKIGSVAPLKDPAAMLQDALGEFPKVHTSGHIFSMTLMGVNGYIHPSILYDTWHKWDGTPVDEPPLIYWGVTQESANQLSAASDEVIAITKEIVQQRPEVDLSNVHHISEWFKRCYFKDILDTSTLYTRISTNQAYRGLTHPMKKTADGKYVPDFQNRYLTEDIPFGLAVLSGVGKLVGVPTPEMDKVLVWGQTKTGKEYIKDGKMEGKDIGETRSPQRYGLDTLDKLLGLE